MKRLRRRFEHTISALAYAISERHATGQGGPLAGPYNDVTRFVLAQHERLPDYLRTAMRLATFVFSLGGFHRRRLERRQRRIESWRRSRLGPARDFVRYHESLATLALYSRSDTPRSGTPVAEPSPDGLRCEIAVIGSGPGGSLSAALLAEAGRDVVLLEEGAFHSLESCDPFTIGEIESKYRSGGQTVAMGTQKIAYVEACCVGGGSEINSGLYHRTPPEVLEIWRKEFLVDDLDEDGMRSRFEANERDLDVSGLDGPAPAASLRLHEGASSLGWRSIEVPRWVRDGERRSMTKTFVPRFLAAGGRLVSQTRVERLTRVSGCWEIDTSRGRVRADTVFVCAGAVHTPALLLRSGIGSGVGRTLRVHPTVKITARFEDVVNATGMGVPVHQVREFSPRMSFGCSISTQAWLALALVEHPESAHLARDDWERMASYYAMIVPEGRGRVSLVPGCRDPLVRYGLTRGDQSALDDGALKLGRILSAAGAVAQYPSRSLMTIHLFSSCPMGEDPARTVTDSFGRVRGEKGLVLNDASLLCTAPGVNPQGTIMAIARRNVERFLEVG